MTRVHLHALVAIVAFLLPGYTLAECPDSDRPWSDVGGIPLSLPDRAGEGKISPGDAEACFETSGGSSKAQPAAVTASEAIARARVQYCDARWQMKQSPRAALKALRQSYESWNHPYSLYAMGIIKAQQRKWAAAIGCMRAAAELGAGDLEVVNHATQNMREYQEDLEARNAHESAAARAREDYDRTTRILKYTALATCGLTAVAIGLTTFVGIDAGNKADAFEDRPFRTERDKERVERSFDLTHGLIGTSAVLATTSIILGGFVLMRRSQRAERIAAIGLRVAPTRHSLTIAREWKF